MIAFIDGHREAQGVEPICKVLPIASSTYHEHAAKRSDPTKLSARARRDAHLQIDIKRVWDTNFQVYGVRKVWRRLQREAIAAPRCQVARLMKRMGVGGHSARQDGEDHAKRQIDAVSPRPGEPAIPGAGAEGLVALGLHLRRYLAGLRLRRLRHRRLCPAHCRVARIALSTGGLRARRARASAV